MADISTVEEAELAMIARRRCREHHDGGIYRLHARPDWTRLRAYGRSRPCRHTIRGGGPHLDSRGCFALLATRRPLHRRRQRDHPAHPDHAALHRANCVGCAPKSTERLRHDPPRCCYRCRVHGIHARVDFLARAQLRTRGDRRPERRACKGLASKARRRQGLSGPRGIAGARIPRPCEHLHTRQSASGLRPRPSPGRASISSSKSRSLRMWTTRRRSFPPPARPA